MRHALKRWIFRLLGKDPEAVVVTFASGPPDLCRRMSDEVRALVPDRRHFLATEQNWPELRRRLRGYRIGLAPLLVAPGAHPLRRAALCLAPRKLLAYNTRLERHHLRPNLASLLFLRGVSLDRIHLRPWWWPFPRRDRTIVPYAVRRLDGRTPVAGRRRVAVLSPYFPYPLSHGGAVRIFHLLREIAREFDVVLFAFTDTDEFPNAAPVLEFCSRVVLVQQPRYREPRWSTLLPPEVLEFRSPAMRRAIDEERRDFGFESLQVEYTQLAPYTGDILVEHDVTYDLFAQVYRSKRTFSAWWDWFRWRRFENAVVRRYAQVVVMSKKDAEMLGPAVRSAVVENGVDLSRFRPEPERPGERLLFIGSFRHFPNIEAYRYFATQVWPLLRGRFPQMELTVVCGPDHLTYWRSFAGVPEPPSDDRIRLLGFVSDVRPLYVEANLVIVPTTVSAGTNVKVLEAMAMQRAVVSTPSGCAGLGLVHGESVWVAGSVAEFAAGVAALIADPARRAGMAQAAHRHAMQNFDWTAIGEKQRDLLRPR
jgi:glycosyltransferase involved in cell wall biosynthesis